MVHKKGNPYESDLRKLERDAKKISAKGIPRAGRNPFDSDMRKLKRSINTLTR